MKKAKLTTLIMLTFFAGRTQTKNFIDQPYIQVSGSADTLVTPNEIFLNIRVSEKETKDKVPLEDQEQKMVTALKGLGVNTEKDLTVADMTSNFSLYILKAKDVIKTRVYMLKVSDAVTAGKVFIKLEELGISNTAVERVDHSDLENIKNMMRANAIADAKARAIAMVKPLNQTVGSAIHIADNENYNELLQGKASGILIRGATTIQGDFDKLPQIDFEKIKVTANINVNFILK